MGFDAEDVAEGGQELEGDPFGVLADHAVDLWLGEGDAPFAQRSHERAVQVGLGSRQPVGGGKISDTAGASQGRPGRNQVSRTSGDQSKTVSTERRLGGEPRCALPYLICRTPNSPNWGARRFREKSTVCRWGGGAAEPLDADPVPLRGRIGQEVAEHLQMGLVGADGRERQLQDRAFMGEELIGITDRPVPRKVPGVIDEPADQAFTSPDRARREVARQLLLFPACEDVLERGICGQCS